MAGFSSDDLGAGDDAVRLTLGGDDVLVAESYEIKQSILTQPAAFSIRLGWGDVVRDLAQKYPPKTPFTLSIGNVVQQTGETDGYELEGTGGATQITIRGRDALAPLHDAYITADESIQNATYRDVVVKAIEASGITNYTLFSTNEANRSALTGVGITQLGAPPDTSQDEVEQTGQLGIINRVVQVKLGEQQYAHLKRILDRAGLFLWATARGDFVLSAPNARQRPTYRIERQRGNDRNAVNVTNARFKNETTPRFSEALIFARGGGRKFGRQNTAGQFVDEEMVALGYNRPLVFKDANVTNPQQAEFYARRKLAESRRAGWQLVYTVAGHTTPSLKGGQRAVWAPDTVVEVHDDEFGIDAPMWIESVEFRRGPATTTTVTLLRPGDLIFGGGED